MKGQLLKATLGFGLAVLFLLFLEGFLWLTNIPERGIYDGDSATVWWLKSNINRTIPHPDAGAFSLITNNIGLRGPPPPNSGDWILALGCSTTLGWGVEASESWTNLLSEAIDVPIVNGGMPGWSTHQAAQRIKDWPERLKVPNAIILAYWVRDAQLAHQPDDRALPTPWPFRMQLARLLGRTLKAKKHPSVNIERVSVETYKKNLTTIRSYFPNASVYGLFFPQAQEDPRYKNILEEQTDLLKTTAFAENLFFPSDPIHLTPEGHRLLANQLSAQLP